MNGLVAWFVRNPVTVNLLTALVLILGIVGAATIRREIMPPWVEPEVKVVVAYPGAGPPEVEQGIVMRIEEAIRDVPHVIELRSVAREGRGIVDAQIEAGADLREAMANVKARVDAIHTLPVDAERPLVSIPLRNHPVLRVAVHGRTDDATLLHWARVLRDELMALSDVGEVTVHPPRVPEIALEVSEHALRSHGTTLDQVVQAVRQFSVDLPAGEIEGPAGGRLRVDGEAFSVDQFARIPVLSGADGTVVTAGQLGRVVEGLTEAGTRARFRGEPALMLLVSRTEEQDALRAAQQVRTHLEGARERYPHGISVSLAGDFTESFASRIRNLFANGAGGLALVFLVLAVFLRLSTAFWVAAGIGVAGLGMFAVAPLLGVTLNMISLFGFVVVLGLLVDDAIIVGESVHLAQEAQRGPPDLEQASIDGTRAVLRPVMMAALTTMVAFAPILFMPGAEAKTWASIGIVVIATLAISLFESLFLLPSHLAEFGRRAAVAAQARARGRLARVRAAANRRMQAFVERRYMPALDHSLARPETVIAAFLGLAIVMFGFMRSGALPMAFFPEVEADAVMVNLELALGTPVERTSELLERMEEASEELRVEIDEGWVGRGQGESIFGPMLTLVGATVSTRERGDHTGGIFLELNPRIDRPVSAAEVAKRWRERIGPIPEATDLGFDHTFSDSVDSVDLRLAHPDSETLRAAADALQEHLKRIPGLYDVTDAEQSGQQELSIGLRDAGVALGLTLADLARQVRQGFYGAEAQRIQRGRDDVRIMVRYPEEERRSIADLEQVRIRTRDGQAIPFAGVATVEFGDAAAAIRRTNRERTLRVRAAVDTKVVELDAVTRELRGRFVPQLEQRFPGIKVVKGRHQRERDSLKEFLGRQQWQIPLMIYLLMAVTLRSYGQPLIVLVAIPFGQIGALIGHLLMGLSLSLLSLLGSIAAAGVVVNDSLVFLDAINRFRARGRALPDAVRQAARLRFRPIVLTSLTTFLGLLPIVLETSAQAQHMVPMAVSLSFGVLFATPVTLLLIPAVCAASERLWRAPRGSAVALSERNGAVGHVVEGRVAPFEEGA